MDTAKKNRNRCCKNCFQKISSKIAEASGDLIGNKTAYKITSLEKRKKMKDKKFTYHQKKDSKFLMT